MSISDKAQSIKISVIYLGVTILCAVTAAVYTSFAHGETSAYMTFLFAYPLTAGIIVCVLRRLGFRDRIFVNAVNSSAATFGAWSCISGIFDMAAGASSPYMPIFLICGIAFAVIAFGRVIFILLKTGKHNK